MIKIICIGKKHEAIYMDAVKYFEHRLSQWQKVEWIILAPSGEKHDKARIDESNRIINRLPEDGLIVLLDEAGTSLTSPDLANYIEQAQNSSKTITYIIGGAYGVSDDLRTSIDTIIAFGKAVFPHQLVRVMLLEQLYRAYSINAGSNYHHL
jgi:23S rRNA (pseudouridine1915-N3)-methyltransferase